MSSEEHYRRATAMVSRRAPGPDSADLCVAVMQYIYTDTANLTRNQIKRLIGYTLGFPQND